MAIDGRQWMGVCGRTSMDEKGRMDRTKRASVDGR
jgi:hypothetical protein